jgi:hypothetical protein
MYVCMFYARMYVLIKVGMYDASYSCFINLCMYVCMHAWMYVCSMYVCMYVLPLSRRNKMGFAGFGNRTNHSPLQVIHSLHSHITSLHTYIHTLRICFTELRTVYIHSFLTSTRNSTNAVLEIKPTYSTCMYVCMYVSL